jgi:CRP/FNR family transcriptional regulator, anaerobic regulatory protein
MNEFVIDLARLRKSCAQCSLHSLCLSAGINGEDLKQLDLIVKNRRPLKRADVLYRAGQTLSSLFIVREGAFKTTLTDEEGVLQVIGFQITGEILGLDGMGSGFYECQAHALTNASLCEISLHELEQVAKQVPRLQHQLLKIIGQNIHRDYQHIEMLARKSADERVAMFLHSLSERYQRLGISGSYLVLPMSREDIGNYLGMAIETVSRTLTKMQDEALIKVQGRQIQILDSARMDSLVHVTAKQSR